ncbi:MAG: amidohydrolase family protein [Sedimentisphaerales bacterium]|nr:amidohydrolase family protein [Sedimentisphaerales bacterium]
MARKRSISRRHTLAGMGALGASAFLASARLSGETQDLASLRGAATDTRVNPAIVEKVFRTTLIDTHEHLIEEKERLAASHPRVQADDWSLLLNHYLNSDLLVAGMPEEAYDRFFSRETNPVDKWRILEPYWPAVKNTGYGQAVRIAVQQIYEVQDLSAETVKKVQAGYERTRAPGFYRRILSDLGRIESCQVNCLSRPFNESDMPTLLMQDLSIVGMFAGPDFNGFGKPTGIEVRSLADWHRVIDWWFDKYAKYAVAVKSQNAYSRDIDYEQVPAEKAETVFQKRLANEPLTADERKALEDHLFWYAVNKATECKLPVKLHTGYYAGQNYMPLGRLLHNAGSVTDLCRAAPQTRFVFMHICYPYYEELLAAAKHYANAYVDMCWSWIINPVAAKDFLKKFLVTAPANKILTFGGDYIPVEPVLGHAAIARRGIALALSELVEEGWLTLADAMDLIDPIMHNNARHIFNLSEKARLLQSVSWT